MQVLGPILLRAGAQSVAQLFGPLRTWKKSFEQRAKIESGSSADDGQVSALLALMQDALAPNALAQNYIAPNYLAQNPPRLARIFSGANVGERIHAIEEVMRNFRALRRTGLGRADFKFAVHRDRVAVDDFTAEAAGDGQRQSCLPACRGTKHDYDERFAIRHIQHIRQLLRLQRALQGMSRQ